MTSQHTLISGKMYNNRPTTRVKMTSHEIEMLYKNTAKDFKWISSDNSQQVQWALDYLAEKGFFVDENCHPSKYDALIALISTWAYDASKLKTMKNTWAKNLSRKRKNAKTQLNCTVSLYTKNQLTSKANRDKTTIENTLEKIIYEYGDIKSKFEKELKLQKAISKERYERLLASKELHFHRKANGMSLNLSRLLAVITGELFERYTYRVLLEDNHIDQTPTTEQEQRAKGLLASNQEIHARLKLLEELCKKKEKKEKPQKKPKPSPKDKRE